MLKPSHFHRWVTRTAQRAVEGSPSQDCSRAPRPSQCKDEVDQPPVIVVEPDPDDSDDDIGHQHGREPDDPQAAAKGGRGEEAKRKQQATQHVGDGADDGEGDGIADRPPEDGIVGQDLGEVLRPTKVATLCGPITCTLL